LRWDRLGHSQQQRVLKLPTIGERHGAGVDVDCLHPLFGA
jgi:hypothetical protein